MSRLGEVLALMHGASDSFETVELELRVWAHVERQVEAGLAEMEEADRQRARRAMSMHAPPGDVPAETETFVRMWFERPDRLREEREGAWPRVSDYGVRIGPRWWRFDAHFGAMTNEGDETHGSGLGQEASPLLDPSRLLPALRFDRVEEATLLERDVRRVFARPRGFTRHEPAADHWLHVLGVGAEEFELDVDAERGVLLRVTALRGDEPFSAREVTSIAFDRPIDPQRFVFEPPPGEEVRPASAVFPGFDSVQLHEAARRVPFTVFTPARVADDWTLRVEVQSAGETGSDLVRLLYRTPNAGAEVMMIQAATGSGVRAGGPMYGQRERIVERDGVRYEVIDRAEGHSAQVSCERGGTVVSMACAALDVDALVDLAASMEPASPDQPAI